MTNETEGFSQLWLTHPNWFLLWQMVIEDGAVSERKIRLYACACCRARELHILSESSRRIIEVAERYADGQVDEGEWLGTVAAAEAALRGTPLGWDGDSPERAVAVTVSRDPVGHVSERYVEIWLREQRPERQAAYVRDIFGNPYRPVTLAPTWLTPTVTSLARVAYEARALSSGELDPTHLAILADALEDAGCTDPDVLGHLRGSGPHVRGCWVMDQLLRKK